MKVLQPKVCRRLSMAAICSILAGCDAGTWDRALARVHEQELAGAVARYHEDTGGYPLSLERLVPDYVPELLASNSDAPMYFYEAGTGDVRVVSLIPKHELREMRAIDASNVAQLRQAVRSYHHDYDEFPAALERLAPMYLAAMPAGATPLSTYTYDARDGTVTLSHEMSALYDSLVATEDQTESDGGVRDTYDSLIDDVDAVRDLTEGGKYPDPRQILVDGTQVFDDRRDAVGTESGSRTLENAQAPGFATDALRRYEERDLSSLPTPDEVLSAGQQVFKEIYGNESDSEVKRENQDVFDSHVSDDGTLNQTQVPSADGVLEAGQKLYQMYVDENPEETQRP